MSRSAAAIGATFCKRSPMAAAASAPPALNTFEGLAAEIDRRVSYIEDVAGEQHTALLSIFSQASGIDLDCITRVNQHLRATDMWDRSQLSAFSACLRANSGPTRLHQPGVNRGMQTCHCFE